MVELGELIRELRTELQMAMTAAEGEELRFELGPIGLELSVAVSKEGGGKARVRFWVADLSGDTKVAQESIQRITLTLQPIVAATGRTAIVTGPATDRER